MYERLEMRRLDLFFNEEESNGVIIDIFTHTYSSATVSVIAPLYTRRVASAIVLKCDMHSKPSNGTNATFCMKRPLLSFFSLLFLFSFPFKY